VVFLAEDPTLQRLVALKVPRPAVLDDPDLRARFLTEARAAARLDHPNIVPVYEAGESGPLCWIASAYCPGTTLAQWLSEHPGPVAPRPAAALVALIADALQHAHERGIVHRDLKPSNLLLVPCAAGPNAAPVPADDLGLVPRLTDFGLAKLVEADASRTGPGVVLGTAAYMAPEQAAGQPAEVSAASDLYALGVILHELLSRQLPAGGRPTLSPQLPAELSSLCRKCLAHNPGQRPTSAGAVAHELRRFLSSPRRRGAYLLLQPRQWLRWALLGGVALLASLIVFGILLRWQLPTSAVTPPEPVAGPADVDDAWLATVGKMKPDDQVKAVCGKLQELNPGFAGKASGYLVEGKAVVSLGLSVERLTNLAPVRALTALRILGLTDFSGKSKLTDLAPLKGMSLTGIQILQVPVSDLAPLQHLPLTQLFLDHTRVCDLTPLRNCSRLHRVQLSNSPIVDLEPLKDLPIRHLDLHGTRVMDLSPLQRCPLANLDLGVTPITDLRPLTGRPLQILGLTATKVTDLSPLAGMPLEDLRLERTTWTPADLPAGLPLRRLLLDGTPTTDLTPLRGYPKLEGLTVAHNPRLTSLAPLQGLMLHSFGCAFTGVADLAALQGMPLEVLDCRHTRVHNLTPLQGTKLRILWAGDTRVTDLTPLFGLPLEDLRIEGTGVTDLSPLAGMPLRLLWINQTPVKDLSPLRGLPLTEIGLTYEPKRDAEVLRSLPKLATINGAPVKEFWGEPTPEVPTTP
jgi:Leucine-rich repeat (LRR) protein